MKDDFLDVANMSREERELYKAQLELEKAKLIERRRISNYMTAGVVAGLAAIMAVKCSTDIEIERERIAIESEKLRKNRYNLALETIEMYDGKPWTTNEDWAIAYQRALNRKFDPLKDDPFTLSFEELGEIIHN